MTSRRILLAASFLVAVTFVFSCKKDGFSSAFDNSYKAWNSFKSSANNTYTYIAYHDPQIGIYWETKVTIKQGDVTARDYWAYENVYKPDSNITRRVLFDEWHESADLGTLGTHGSDGWGLYTMDDVYYRAQNVWITANADKNIITFEANNSGLISAAGYTPKSCKNGDCFIGIKIKSITR